MTDSLMLLYQNSGPYFFESCPDIAHPVLSESPMLRRCFRLARRLRLDCLTPRAYGEWTRHVGQVKSVVILDSAFDWGLPGYIKKMNPRAQMILLFWNPMRELQIRIMKHFLPFGVVASYNREDCEKYGMEYIPPFYSKSFADHFSRGSGGGVLFLGGNKGRLSQLEEIADSLQRQGVEHNLKVVGDVGKSASDYRVSLLRKPVPYREYCEEVARSDALLDISQPGVQALNLRVMESLFFQKKLITTNESIKNCDFYSPQNIYLIEGDDHGSLSGIREFVEAPFAPYGESVLEKYDIFRTLTNALNREVEVKHGS